MFEFWSFIDCKKTHFIIGSLFNEIYHTLFVGKNHTIFLIQLFENVSYTYIKNFNQIN